MATWNRAQRREPAVFFTTERILRWMRWYNANKDPHPELTRFERERFGRRPSPIRSMSRRLNGVIGWRRSQQSSSY